MVVNTGNTNNDLFITNERVAASSRTAKNESNGKTIFAGNLKKPTDLIAVKRQQAQKKASKIVGDVFKSAKKIEKNMTAMLDKSQELLDQRIADKATLQDIEDQRRNIMERYNVTEDSEEYKDLELLRKEKEAKNPLSGIELTEDEQEKLTEMHKEGLTIFQSDMLFMDDAYTEYENRIQSNEKAIKAIQQAWGDMKVELLKSEPMQEAQEKAEDVLMTANKEIIGDLRKEAVDHVEEKLEDVVEEAKKKAEEKKKKESKLEDRKEKQTKLDQTAGKNKNSNTSSVNTTPRHDSLDKVMDNLSSYSTQKSTADKKLKKIMDELDLIMEDLKGTEVDKYVM